MLHPFQRTTTTPLCARASSLAREVLGHSTINGSKRGFFSIVFASHLGSPVASTPLAGLLLESEGGRAAPHAEVPTTKAENAARTTIGRIGSLLARAFD